MNLRIEFESKDNPCVSVLTDSSNPNRPCKRYRFDVGSGTVEAVMWYEVDDISNGHLGGNHCSMSHIGRDGVMRGAVVRHDSLHAVLESEESINQSLFIQAKSILSRILLDMACDVDSVELP